MEHDYARIAYDAYRDHTGGKSLVSGQPIPGWDELPEPIQQAWEAAGSAVRELAGAQSCGCL